MPTAVDDDLAQLERDIRQLKVEYDQYFGGGRKRPPTEIEWRIDNAMKRNAERMGEFKFAHRFRFNNIAQTYAKYKDIFRKKLQQREEGNVQRHFGAAARAIEAERQRSEAARSVAQKSSHEPFRIACSEPDQETEKVEQLYQAFVSAKRDAGEKTERITRESFQVFVRNKTRDLKNEKGCQRVEYVVEVVGDKVKLKARVTD